jgi:hypothetical protein
MSPKPSGLSRTRAFLDAERIRQNDVAGPGNSIVARSCFFCFNTKKNSMLLREGGTLTTEAYMGTVAKQLEMRRPGVKTASVRFFQGEMRAADTMRLLDCDPAWELSSLAPLVIRASGEVAPR